MAIQQKSVKIILSILTFLIASNSEAMSGNNSKELSFIESKASLNRSDQEILKQINKIKDLIIKNKINLAEQKIAEIAPENIYSEKLINEYYYCYSKILKINYKWSEAAKKIKQISTNDQQKQLLISNILAYIYGREMNQIQKAKYLVDISRTEKQETIKELIWDSLKKAEIQDLLTNKGQHGRELNGWIDLMIISKSSEDSYIKLYLKKWEEQYPDHPAYNIKNIILSAFSAQKYNQTSIAVLIDGSKKYEKISISIKTGILKAIEDLNEQFITKINFYDTDKDPNKAFRDAVKNGATVIIGPLLKENVVAITEENENILHINLNRKESIDYIENKLYVDLSSKNIINEAIKKMSANGIKRPIIFYKNTTKNKKMADLFQTQWQGLNGNKVEAYSYNKFKGIKKIVQQALLVDEHRKKVRYIRHKIGSIESDSRVRKDIDGVYIINNSADEIKMIKPFIDTNNERFYKKIAVYAGNKVINYRDKNTYRELKGTVFYDIEYPKEIEYKDFNTTEFKMFYLGYDIFNLIQNVKKIKISKNSYAFKGKLGNYEIEDNIIKIKQKWQNYK